MYKFLILIASMYAITASAGSIENSCNQAHQSLKILPVSRDLAFGYMPKTNQATLFFYAVVPTGNENPDKNLSDLLKVKGHLKQRQGKNKSIQAIYEVPKHTKKIFFITSRSKIEGLETYARIEPSFSLDSSSVHDTRSPSNYAGDLLAETSISQTNENTQLKAVEICEYLM